MSSRTLWGGLEPAECEETLFQNVDFSQMIELTMHQIPDIPSTAKSTVVEFPVDNVIQHTIALHDHARQLTAIFERTQGSIVEGAPIEGLSMPPAPQSASKVEHHKLRTPINFVDKDYCDFSLGKGPTVLPLKPEEHRRALRQCAALAFAHLGVYAATRTTVEVLADALDHYLWTMTRLMRTVADSEAGGLRSGFPDIACKTFTEMHISNLHDFHRNRIVQYRNKIDADCQTLAEAIRDLLQSPPQQLKLEEVPELHFPAALSEVFTPSLEPGFQMLHSLEQEELQGLELLETVPHDDIKLEVVEYSAPTASAVPAPDTSPSLSPRTKKKRK